MNHGSFHGDSDEASVCRTCDLAPVLRRQRSSLRSRGLKAVFALMLAPAFVLASPFAASSAHASSAVEKAECRVHAVLASKEGDGTIPKNLEFLRETLEDDAFAAYKGFHLLDKKNLKPTLEHPAEAGFKSGHKLRLTLLGGGEGKLKFRADLSGRDGKSALIGTDYTIDDNGLLMIQAGRYTSGEIAGKLFFAIQCARRG